MPADDTGLDEIEADVTERLRVADQRYTSGRRRVITALHQSAGPMTLQQILDTDGRLAQSSVYRNLVILEEVGVVSRIVTNDDFARFEIAEDLTEHHHHLICSECGDVIDFALPPKVETQLDKALRNAAKRAGFHADAHRLDLLGQCAQCS